MVDRLIQSLLGRLDGGTQNGLGIAGLFGGLNGSVTGNAGHRQDGALGGLHHGLIGSGSALFQALSQNGAVSGAGVLHALGNAAEQQRGDNTGVAAGTAEQSAGSDLQGAAQSGVFQLVQLLGSVVQGHGHIGAGVAIGHREDVEGVDFLNTVCNGSSCRQDHFFIGFAIDHFRHYYLPPTLLRGLTP